MTRSLSRWLAIMALVVGAISPNLARAQVVMSFTDDDDPTYPIAAAAEEDEKSVDDYEDTMPQLSTDQVFSGGGSCCDVCYDECGCVPRNWVTADYLMWWTKGNDLPTLLSSSPAGTPQVDAGVLPGAQSLFGGTIDDELRNGLRLNFGHWADPEGTVGWQVSYFSVFDDSDSGDYTARTTGALGGGTGAPILARPFFNTSLGIEDSRLISFPNLVDGTIAINSSSEMHSISLLLRQHLRSGSRGRVDLIGGYRYFRFREGLRIQESLVVTDPAGVVPFGTTLDIEDRFTAKNDFHGGDLGFIAEFWQPGFSVELLAKVALGNVRRRAEISGSTVTNGALTTSGGLLALPTNIGTREANDFAALPEFGVNLKFEPRKHVSLNVGYSLLMLNDIVRTGELIDRNINPTQLSGGALVGPANPSSLFASAETDFWAQGLNFGVSFAR